MIRIRPENTCDQTAVRLVNEQAFARQNEADLVDTLREADGILVSLVALLNKQIVGHIMFSPVRIESDKGVKEAVGLGPMTVLPAYQNQGVGSRLVEKGLRVCADNGFTIVAVLGHPAFYPRFGFVPAKPLGIQWERDVPDDVFMVTALTDNALTGVTGVVKYHPAFHRV